MKWNIFSTRNEEKTNNSLLGNLIGTSMKGLTPIERHDMHPQVDFTKFTVQDIHNSFDTAHDNIPEFDESLSVLGDIGFRLVDGVGEARLLRDISEGKNKYAQIYPSYKYIHHSHVKELCEKYGLLHGDVSRYKGKVPSKNAAEIAYFHKNIGIKLQEEYFDFIKGIGAREGEFPSLYTICAPQDDFILYSRDRIVCHKIVSLPDPIVLCQVGSGYGHDGYLIVSKWGLEGEDESLTNEKMN